MQENKTNEKVVKPKSCPELKSKHFEEIYIPTEQRQEILNDLSLA